MQLAAAGLDARATHVGRQDWLERDLAASPPGCKRQELAKRWLVSELTAIVTVIDGIGDEVSAGARRMGEDVQASITTGKRRITVHRMMSFVLEDISLSVMRWRLTARTSPPGDAERSEAKTVGRMRWLGNVS